MEKKQFLAEITLSEGESLIPYINAALAKCKKENNSVNEEVHQIIAVKPGNFVVLINHN